MCDAFEVENLTNYSLKSLKDELALLRRTIIYKRVKALYTNDLEISLINIKEFNNIVLSSYRDKPCSSTDQTLRVS
jgi:hypothetical protein